jgi:membrane fusion protein (multidrug efflux system)
MSSTQKNTVARIVSDSTDENAVAQEAGASAEAPTADARGNPAAAPAKAEAPQPAPAQVVAAPVAPKKKRSPVLPIIALLAIAGGGWYGYNYWTVGRFMVSTDDAYIEGDIATISPKVTGYVAKVNVVANQQVKAGDVLATLDSGDYKIALDQAQAAVDTETLSLQRLDAQIAGGQASVQQAQAQKAALQATVRGAQITQQRASEMQAKAVGTQSALDSANIALDQANANLIGGDAAIASAQANLAILQSQRREADGTVKQLELARDKAARDLSFTVLKAPYDGVIGNRSVQEGDYVTSTNRLMAIVPTRQLYIDANFKETQIQHLVPGSKVDIYVDAYSGKPIVGTVESLAPASGAVFSLLPPENATGNFTKVIQRVPVRIAIPQNALNSGRLRAGLSVVVDVDIRTAPDAQN